MRSESLLTKKTTWVIVADESAATVYVRKFRRDSLTELFSLENKTARKKIGDLISDRGGRSFDSHGQGRHTMAKEKIDPKKHVAIAFAKKLAIRANKALHDGTCDEFVLIAAPRFLGILRDAFTKAGNVDPVLTIDKEMVGQNVDVIEKLLAEY